MSDTLRDQLLGLGFKPAPTPEKSRDPRRKDGRGNQARAPEPRGARPPRQGGEERRRDGQAPKGPRGPGGNKAPGGRARGPRPSGDIDLAKAYAIRAQREKDERIEAERQKQEAARQKREAKAKVVELLAGKALNANGAEIARHFEYGGKIRRIYVTAEQLTALNAGELAVVQLDGHYLLVSLELASAVEALLPSLLALRVDPGAPVESDPYDDPKYQVPDDLVW